MISNHLNFQSWKCNISHDYLYYCTKDCIVPFSRGKFIFWVNLDIDHKMPAC